MDIQDVLYRHPVSGAVQSAWIIPPREYCSFNLLRGQVLRFVDIEGRQVPDFVCFNAFNLKDELNVANSQLLSGHLQLIEGDVLYSVLCTPLMRIVGYSNPISFAYGSMCSEMLNRLRYGVANTRNCRDNLGMALAPWGFGPADIPNAFVPFMNAVILPNGDLEIAEPTSQPGDHYDLGAEADLVVAVSNCPQERNPVNAFNPTSMGIVIYSPV